MRLTITLGLGILIAGVAAGQDTKKSQPASDPPIVKPREGKSETIKLFNGKTSTAGRATATSGRSRTA